MRRKPQRKGKVDLERKCIDGAELSTKRGTVSETEEQEEKTAAS